MQDRRRACRCLRRPGRDRPGPRHGKEKFALAFLRSCSRGKVEKPLEHGGFGGQERTLDVDEVQVVDGDLPYRGLDAPERREQSLDPE